MVEFTAPGVFVEEIGATAKPIEGAPTSIAAFIGRAWRGPLDLPTEIASFADYEHQFGGLWRQSTLGFAVKHFFENGGAEAVVVRVATRAGASAASAATIKLKNGEVFRATSPGSWGLNLKVTIDHASLDPLQDKLFNLTVTEDAGSKRDSEQRGGTGDTERYFLVSVDPANPNFVGSVLERQSQLLRLESGLRAVAPADQVDAMAADDSGTDGAPIGPAEVTAQDNREKRTGLYALDSFNFNLLCIPPFVWGKDNDITDDWAPAARYCRECRAMLIVDAPADWTADNALANLTTFGAFGAFGRENAALYFPRVLAPNPLDGGKLTAFAPCGMIAGVICRTDAARGVWVAPAGPDALLRGVAGLSIRLTEIQIGTLSAGGINCLRELPNGWVIWGARTLVGADTEASTWKYLPVRRLALHIERSLDEGTAWILFEGITDRTVEKVVEAATAFLTGLWRQGALKSIRPDTFFVGYDYTPTTGNDCTFVIRVGVALVRPTEFVILQIPRTIR